jgi:hypothetical protein
MAERSRALVHLVRSLEELLRAGAEAAAELADRSRERRVTQGVATVLAGWLEAADGPALDALREALRRERSRWESRAAHDPAAARVRDLFAALLEVLGDDAGAAGPRASGRSRRVRPRAPRARPGDSSRSV